MADITNEWNRKMPSGSSDPSDGDDLMRQHWTSLESVWDEEHFFSGSSTSAGIHKEGSARIYRGPASEVSSGGRDDRGRLMFAENTGALHYLRDSSTSTVVIETSSRSNFGVRADGSFNPAVTGELSTSTAAFSFDGVDFDEGGFFDLGGAGNTSVFTVPTGADGRYEAALSAAVEDATLNRVSQLAIRHNGSIVALANAGSGGLHTSALLDGISSGDSFEFAGWAQSSGVTLKSEGFNASIQRIAPDGQP